jgi:hypothetical protein
MQALAEESGPQRDKSAGAMHAARLGRGRREEHPTKDYASAIMGRKREPMDESPSKHHGESPAKRFGGRGGKGAEIAARKYGAGRRSTAVELAVKIRERRGESSSTQRDAAGDKDGCDGAVRVRTMKRKRNSSRRRCYSPEFIDPRDFVNEPEDRSVPIDRGCPYEARIQVCVYVAYRSVCM